MRKEKQELHYYTIESNYVSRVNRMHVASCY